MRKKRFCLWILIPCLLVQADGETIFHDTFQAGNDTPVNVDYAQRQTNGLVTASYVVSTKGNPVNNIRILDTSYTGIETAMVLRMFNPAVGADSTTAVQLSPDFSPYLAGTRYSIHLDARIINGGGDPAIATSWLGVGIIGSSDKAYVPLSVNTDFGVRIDAAGGGIQVYSDGTLVYSNATSSLTYGSRFDLTLNVDETVARPAVQILLQKDGGAEVDLGSYGFDVDPADTKRLIQLRGYTKDDDLTSGGLMTVEVYEMSITVP